MVQDSNIKRIVTFDLSTDKIVAIFLGVALLISLWRGVGSDVTATIIGVLGGYMGRTAFDSQIGGFTHQHTSNGCSNHLGGNNNGSKA